MSNRLALIICAILMLIFSAISYLAVLGKSPTMDEPFHFTAAYTGAFEHDFRTDIENPPLWKHWAMLPIRRGSMPIDPSNRNWRKAGVNNDGVTTAGRWTVRTLFASGIDGVALINRARFMMLLLSLPLLALTAWWAWKLGGAWAAVGSMLLLAFDPTLLAFAPILKNDVALSLAMLLLMVGLWQAGRRLTPLNAAIVALACAIGINVKYSGLLLPIIAVLVLLIRAALPAPWPVLGRELRARFHRLAVVPVMLVWIGAIAWGMTWADYDFRFAPSNDPQLKIESNAPFAGAAARSLAFAQAHHLLPQPFCAGLPRLEQAMSPGDNYLMGTVSDKGWWYYFPLAMLFKMPLATLIGLAAACALCGQLRGRVDGWSLCCLVVPLLVYGCLAMASNLDHGIRHLLPIFPFIFVYIAVVFARLMERKSTNVYIYSAVLAACLVGESAAAFPNYISFFNLAAGGSRGGLSLLSDSNLDWGQDLPLLSRWQRENPDITLYFAYFGSTDPAVYRIKYLTLPGSYMQSTPPAFPDPGRPGVLAISATILQTTYVHDPQALEFYRQFSSLPTREVLGGSIYLYDWPPAR